MDLDSSYRCWLISRAAIDFDRHLNEKLVGLTHDESIFFVEISKVALSPLKTWSVDELKRFIELYDRHERILAFQRKARPKTQH